jgi:hypothetical protein
MLKEEARMGMQSRRLRVDRTRLLSCKEAERKAMRTRKQG